MAKFTMVVELGNAAMQNSENLVSVLEHVAAQIRNGEFYDAVRDGNGNTVGSWEVTGR